VSDWVWEVDCYFGDDSDHPGEIDSHTVHDTEESKDAWVDVNETRDDIGEVVVTRRRR
jgi:hypothetical protein